MSLSQIRTLLWFVLGSRLSGPIPYSTVSPIDGDVLMTTVDWNLEDPLENAVYTRLIAVDAPELSAVHFVKTDGLQHMFVRGHLSLCALHFFLSQFAYAGCAELCENGMERQEGLYGPPIKEFRLRFKAPLTEKEVTFFPRLKALVPAKSETRKRLTSPYAVSQGSPDQPFLLSINALMVVTAEKLVFE